MKTTTAIRFQLQPAYQLWTPQASGAGVFFILLLAYAAILPNVHLIAALSLYDAKRIVQIALLVANGIWLLCSLRKPEGPISSVSSLGSGVRGALAGMLLLGCISSFLAPQTRYGLLEVFHLGLLVLLTLTVAHLCRERPRAAARLAAGTLALAALWYILAFGADYALTPRYPGVRIWPAADVGFEHIRFFNQYQTWSLPLLVLPAMLFANGSRRARYLLLAPAAGWWMLLLGSGGRGTLLGVIAAAAFVACVFGRHAICWLKLQGGAAAVGVVAYGLVFKVASSAGASLLDRDFGRDMGRFGYWWRDLEVIRDNWLLGISPMHYAGFEGNVWSHPHNVLVQWGVEWGLLATLLLVLAVFWGMRAWTRQCRRLLRSDAAKSDAGVRIALTASLVAAATHAVFSGVTIMPMSQMMMVLVIGWAFGLYLRRQDQEHDVRPVAVPSRTRAGAAILIVVAVGVVLATTLPDARRREESRRAFFEATESRTLHPRFWLQGNLNY